MIRPPGVPTGMRAFVDYLGNSPREITKTLILLDCKGYRNHPSLHPIAMAIRRYVETWPHPDHRRDGVFFHDAQIIDFYFSALIRDWLKDFDAGKYPDLIIEGPPPKVPRRGGCGICNQ